MGAVAATLTAVASSLAFAPTGAPFAHKAALVFYTSEESVRFSAAAVMC